MPISQQTLLAVMGELDHAAQLAQAILITPGALQSQRPTNAEWHVFARTVVAAVEGIERCRKAAQQRIIDDGGSDATPPWEAPQGRLPL